jgi:upstream activation factor subunit UAF30
MSVEALTPVIRGILTAPDVDLRTISAKRVRKQIVQQDPSLSDSWIRDNKEQIDKLIGGIFEEVASASAQAASTSEGEYLVLRSMPWCAELTCDTATNGKRKHEELEDGPEPSSASGNLVSVSRPTPPSSAPATTVSTASKPSVISKPPAKKEGSKDEEVARQLAAELNTPRTRSSGSDKRSTKKVKPKKKSAARVGGVEEGDEPPKKRARGGFQKEYTLRLGSLLTFLILSYLHVLLVVHPSPNWYIQPSCPEHKWSKSYGNTSRAIISRIRRMVKRFYVTR